MTGVLQGKTIELIKGSSGAVYVLANDKRVYRWGVVNGISSSNTGTPGAIDWSGVLNGKEVKQLEAGGGATSGFVLASDNQLYAWGLNTYGLVLGPNGLSTTFQELPVAVDTSGIGDRVIRKIYTGMTDLFIETTDNRLFGAGRNVQYVIAPVSTQKIKHPLTEMDLSGIPEGVSIQKLISVTGSVAILGSDSKLYMWGDIRASGRKIESIPYLPNVANVTFNMADIKQLHPGANHFVAVTNDNRYFLWGQNSQGQIGQGHSFITNSPVELLGYDISQIFVRDNNNLIVTKQGKVYGWGLNSNGEIGTHSVYCRHKSLP